MKNIILILFILISSLAYSQTTPSLKKVLGAGNDGNGLQIKNISEPTSAQDAATKNYVDNSSGSATSLSVADDNSTNATMYPLWVTGTSGNQSGKVSSTKFRYNPNKGRLLIGSKPTGPRWPFELYANQDSMLNLVISNPSLGGSAGARIIFSNFEGPEFDEFDAHYGQIGFIGRNLSGSQSFWANTLLLGAGGQSNGMRMFTDNGMIQMSTRRNTGNFNIDFNSPDFVLFGDGTYSSTTAGRIGIGTATPTERLHVLGAARIEGVPLTDQKHALTITAQMPSGTVSSFNSMVDIACTALASTNNQYAMNVTIANPAGNDGNLYAASRFHNSVAGTGNIFAAAFNCGMLNTCISTTTGDNVGTWNYASGGNRNFGAYGQTTIAKNSATNIGVAGFSLNTGSSPIHVAGYFGLQAAYPTFVSAAIIGDNGTTTSPIFLGRDNGSIVFTIADGGAVTSTVSMAAPIGSFSTSTTSPLLIGGSSTTQTLTYKTTTGVGATGADHIFQVGNNGATEAMRILNSGNVGIANTAPSEKLDVTGNIRFSGALMPNNTAGTSGQVLTSAGAGTVPTWTTPATGGDASTNTATSVDNEIALFSSTTGKILKRATTTGMLKGTSGVLSAGTSGTDYSAGTSGLATGILKSTTGTGDLTIAIAGDFPTLNQNTTGTASNVTGTVAIANGGTGQTTATLGFNALSPVTTRGDIIVRGATNNDRLALGSAGKILRSDGTDLVYSTAAYPNTIGASEIPYATSADVIGSNSAFTYNGTQLFIGNSGASATPLWIYRDINGSMQSRVENINTGTIASANVRIANSNSYLMLSKLSTGYTTSGILTANAGVIDNATGNLILRTVSSTDIVFGNTSELFRMTSDGRLYGTAIHNNAGSVTGTTNQYIASGTYTATLTNVTNVAASTSYQAQWSRVGNVVTVSGKFDLDATSAGSTATELGLSLPIASNFAAEENLGGNASSDAVASAIARIKADAANDRAAIVFKAISDTNDSYAFTFTYLIL